MNYEDLKYRLTKVLENRNFFFKATYREDAERFLNARRNFGGLTNEEINKLTTQIQKSFPDEFIEYLKVFGKNCGELFCTGQDLNPDNLLEYQDWAKELLEESEIENFLRADDLVFHFHQGYIFLYFKKEGNKFVVYEYVEGEKKPNKRFESFNDLLFAEIEQIESMNEKGQKGSGHFLTILGDGMTLSEHPALNSGINPRKIGDRFKGNIGLINLIRSKLNLTKARKS